MVIETHFSSHKTVSKDTIVFDERVRKLCERNACGQYGKTWVCPPGVGDLPDLRSQMAPFEKAVIVNRVYDVKSSYDWKGMVDALADFRNRLIEMKNEFPANLDYMILAAGSCTLCKTCGYPEGKACNRPDDAFVSLEAFGIDVALLMKKNNLKYYHGTNTVNYIGMVLYK